MQKATLILIALFTLLPLGGNAHPGRTAADGCHYCRTNCDSWGEEWNERHCHGGYVAPLPSAPIVSPTPATTTPKPAVTPLTDRTTITVAVTEVIDGDTIRVRLSDGSIEKVRIIGMDTPESKDPRKPVECFANEATAHLQQLLQQASSSVTLIRDSVNDNRDTYQRLLRHVYIEKPGEALYTVAERMILDGYAYAYTKYPFEKTKMDAYVAAQGEARTLQRGLWAPGECEEDPRVAAYASTPRQTKNQEMVDAQLDSSIAVGEDVVNRSDHPEKMKSKQRATESEGWGGFILLVAVLGGVAYLTRPSTWKKIIK